MMEEKLKAIEVLKAIDKILRYRNEQTKKICEDNDLTVNEVLEKTAQLDATTLARISMEISIFERTNWCILNPKGS